MIGRSWVVVVSVVALAAGCKGKQAAAPKEVGPFTCKDVQNDACIGPTDTFEATVPVVHFTYKTADLPKNGDIYTIKWIAEDVGQAAPANTVIATNNETVDDMVDAMKSYTVNGRLTQPTAGWPVGKYRVEITR